MNAFRKRSLCNDLVILFFTAPLGRREQRVQVRAGGGRVGTSTAQPREP
jgi:hypothetical protein